MRRGPGRGGAAVEKSDMRASIAFLGWLALVGAGCLAAPVEAQPTGTTEVLLARAPADVTPRGETAARPVVKGARLSEGDRVRTGRGGAVEMRMADGSLVRLGELSDLEIERMEVDAAGAPSTSRFNLVSGQTRAWVARQLIAKVAAGRGGLAVGTPTAVAAVRQTDFAVSHDPGAVTRVFTFEGAVETASRAGGTVFCTRNRWTQVPPGQAPGSCAIIPLRDKRVLLKDLAIESATVGPQDLDRSALGVLGTKLSSEKMTGSRATGGFGTLAPGVPSGTGRPTTVPTTPVDVIITID
jgi:hypothetical protein